MRIFYYIMIKNNNIIFQISYFNSILSIFQTSLKKILFFVSFVCETDPIVLTSALLYSSSVCQRSALVAARTARTRTRIKHSACRKVGRLPAREEPEGGWTPSREGK